jgi:uroporphyrinogen III methyltransferase / synthase
MIRVASRTSNLAIAQVRECFSKLPNLEYQHITLECYGDKHKNISLFSVVVNDFFTKEIDEMLLSNEADIAIHSAKDLPFPLKYDLEVIALTECLDNTDSLVSKNNFTIETLPTNSRVGTSSKERAMQIKRLRNDIKIVSIRGNIEERLQYIENNKVEAIIVATCALIRLKITNYNTSVLPFKCHPLQGHLAIVAKKNRQDLKNIFNFLDKRSLNGTVYLVGAGPGDPDLLTVKAVKLLNKADVVLYDELVGKEILNNIKAELIFVGKKPYEDSIKQDSINYLLYKNAVAGKLVVRLKGGDTAFFSRGAEEINYLKKNLVNVKVIPGITAASAASANILTPLTIRNVASQVTFLSGHQINKSDSFLNETLVYYMASKNIKIIAEKLLKKGYHNETKTILVYNASKIDEEVYEYSLSEIVNATFNFKSPLIFIIGDICDYYNIYSKPVLWQTGTEKYSNISKFNNIHIPIIKIEILKKYEWYSRFLDELNTANYLIFTSKFSVQAVLNTISDIRVLSKVKIVSIGKRTTEELNKFKLSPDFTVRDESSVGIVVLFRKENIQHSKILIPRSDKALDIMPTALRLLNNHVVPITVYKNTVIEDKPNISLKNIDFIGFYSSSGVEAFYKLYGSFPKKKYIVKGRQTFNQLNKYVAERNIFYENHFINNLHDKEELIFNYYL